MLHVLRAAFAAGLVVAPVTAIAQQEGSPRVEALLKSMTLEEKVGQLTLDSNGPHYSDAALKDGTIGSVLNFGVPADAARIQAVGPSRSGVPVLRTLDVIHGYRTLTPVPLAEAATFDPRYATSAAELAAREARLAGIDLTFAPVGDIARDPRWGRMVEGTGEDPFLARLFTRARIAGFARGGLGTTLKHFAGYGAVEGGREYDAVDISPSRFANTYLPPYRAAIEAGVDAVMTAYVAVDGVPATANRALMTGLLRQSWGFSGVVMSDMNAIAELVAHGVARDGREAALKAFRAGVDMDMDSDLYRRWLPELVRSGQISEAELDRSVRRVLTLKEKLGMFERERADAARTEAGLVTPEARRIARDIAGASMVLLKNDRDTLPVAGNVRRIAVIGGLADSPRDTLGAHGANARDEDTVTVLAGIRRRAAASGIDVAYAPGCQDLCADASGFDAAIEAAKTADLSVVVLGEPRELTGEAASRPEIELPGKQAELVARLAATGKPFAVVLLAGRSLALENIAGLAPAMLVAWQPGTEGGNAVADIVFGDVSPSGRLPVTFPRSTGQVPMTYDRLPTGRPADAAKHDTSKYVEGGVGPLYPFGYGLTYGRVAYSDLTLESDRLEVDGTLSATVRLTNSGARKVSEAVQLYVNQPVATASRPVKELKAIDKVALEPGESREVTLRVPVKELGFVGPDNVYGIEPGEFRLWVGPSSQDGLAASFEVIDSPRTGLAQMILRNRTSE